MKKDTFNCSFPFFFSSDDVMTDIQSFVQSLNRDTCPCLSHQTLDSCCLAQGHRDIASVSLCPQVVQHQQRLTVRGLPGAARQWDRVPAGHGHRGPRGLQQEDGQHPRCGRGKRLRSPRSLCPLTSASEQLINMHNLPFHWHLNSTS